mmetsp:Transcript_36035/g.70917  ORF Transcript_36035/g.70917 Transcript_36035/m.70917 type:complete len:93 (-) Transcript_36035:3218-3496(-)
MRTAVLKDDLASAFTTVIKWLEFGSSGPSSCSPGLDETKMRKERPGLMDSREKPGFMTEACIHGWIEGLIGKDRSIPGRGDNRISTHPCTLI